MADTDRSDFVEESKRPLLPVTLEKTALVMKQQKMGTQVFNQLNTEEESEAGEGGFYEDIRRFDSVSSEFSLCSDIGAIGGIPQVNEF